MSKLTHLDEKGHARMVDVSGKDVTAREAIAKGSISMNLETLGMIRGGTLGKGDALAVARIAGIQAAKRTADLIPLCHPLPLTQVTVDLEINAETSAVDITARVKTTGQTGVEMEALTAVSIAALALYDMCKASDRSMRITDLRLTRKTGGKSGTYQAD
ncbi:MAG: cyclic pyranopterin monophosphate synthase MoaC [Proteobacteria bacterium]|nr:cyclic pyranopterin monophosphate synthase MoaC [Pseudomonadota bacterium]